MKNSKMKNKKLGLSTVFIVITFIVLIIYTLSMLFPLGWGLLTSLKSQKDFTLYDNVLGFPSLEHSRDTLLRLENYTNLFGWKLKVGSAYYNAFGQRVENSETYGFLYFILFTLLYAGGGCLIATFVPCIVAYLCVKYPFRLSKVVYVTALLIMIIPIVGAYPSELKLLQSLGLYDTIYGSYIQKFNFTGMYFFVFFAFFQSLPDSYSEAAEIDGASQLSILVRIIIPLTRKIILTVMLILFISFWDDYQTPLLYLPTKPTLAYAVFKLTRDTGQSSANGKSLNNVPAKIAGCMLLALPILIIFIAFQKRLMGNVSMGGLKE